MAPVEPQATAHTNSLPIALFSGQILLVAGLTAHLLFKTYRAARTLPPPTATRSQQPLRQHHAVVFVVLALLSLASTTIFAVMWRARSYVAWAEKGNYEIPGSLWQGWYGTGEEGVGYWHLGDWLTDVSLIDELDNVASGTPGYYYVKQHYLGLIACAIFMGVEGHRRNFSTWNITSFIVLGTLGSLGYALSLFFITMLYTPLAIHDDDVPRNDALFTPKPALYNTVLIITSLYLPSYDIGLERTANATVLCAGYIAVPLFLALAPQIVPLSWGRHHDSQAAAHRSFMKSFTALSIIAFLLHWEGIISNVFSNTPSKHSHIHDVFMHAIGRQNKSGSNRLLSGLSTTAQKLKLVSEDPAISVTSLDILFTIFCMLAWTFTRNLDADAIIDNSILSFLASKSEKHVAFEDSNSTSEEDEPEHESPPPTITPKKRGRPRKNPPTNGISSSTSVSSAASLRRSTRKTRGSYESDSEAKIDSTPSAPGRTRQTGDNNESDSEAAFEPASSTKRDIAQTETDGTANEGDLISGGESTALALFITFIGGLGQLAAAVLGAEASGSSE